MLPATPANRTLFELAISEATALSASMRARALFGWPRFQDNLHVYRAALLTCHCDARQADQLGTLFAAAEMMLSDHSIDSDSAAAHIEDFKDALRQYQEEDEELSNARRCYSTLLTTHIEPWRGGSKNTIGRVIQLARGTGRADERRALVGYGLRLETNAGGKPELWVANQHRGLEGIFKGTAWGDGAWRRALLQLSGVVPGDRSMSFDGDRSRFVIVPEPWLPEAASEAAPDAWPLACPMSGALTFRALGGGSLTPALCQLRRPCARRVALAGTRLVARSELPEFIGQTCARPKRDRRHRVHGQRSPVGRHHERPARVRNRQPNVRCDRPAFAQLETRPSACVEREPQRRAGVG